MPQSSNDSEKSHKHDSSRNSESVARTKTVHPSNLNRPAPIERRYKMGTKIGSGGFGDVYQAWQTSPIRREVAIKIARKKLDSSESRDVLSRFRQERQALALMSHDGIAKIFDAGTAKNGQPFFVMELVKGGSVTECCEKHELSLNQRINLVLQICNAVLHAHQKGIIHRDLKPANILVTGEPSAPSIKVIDFGIAKVTDVALFGDAITAVTQAGSTLGTCLYMSPEQTESKENNIDTRTDVYSIGIILFELITGTTPLQFLQSVSDHSVDPIHWIKYVECVKPSECIAKITKGRKSNHKSKDRHAKPARLTTPDLDLIVLGATEKDRERRYSSITELADDLQHYLDGEPIKRRPASAGYIARKLAAKYKGYVAAVAALFIVLAVGPASTFVLCKALKDFVSVLLQSVKKLESTNANLERANNANVQLLAQASHVFVDRGGGVEPSRSEKSNRIFQQCSQPECRELESPIMDQFCRPFARIAGMGSTKLDYWRRR
ncbi:MAG: serine/threonine-protein kinase [Pirellulaceae bacterium]